MRRPALLLALLTSLAACDETTPPSECGTNGGSVLATIDGQPFTASCIVAARTDDGVGFVADDRSAFSSIVVPRRELSFDVPSATGTYALSGAASALAYFSLIPPVGGGTPSRFAADSGSVVIESIAGRRYRGRFSFRTGTRTSNPHSVGNGRFDVTLQGN